MFGYGDFDDIFRDMDRMFSGGSRYRGGASIIDMFTSVFDELFSSTFLWVFLGIIALGMVIVMYIFDAYTLKGVGRKAGLQKDWMTYVPFARTIYRVKIIGDAWWKMFFLEYWWIYVIILQLLTGLFDERMMGYVVKRNNGMHIFGDVLCALVVLCHIGYNVQYRDKFYKAFGIKNTFALSVITVWGMSFLTKGVDCLIAFTNIFAYGDTGEARKIGEVVQRPAQQRPSGGACGLTGVSGMYANQNIDLMPNEELTIGRDPALANLIIDINADRISRKHCGVKFDPARGAYLVTDYSTNGTFIDGGSRLVANVPSTMQRGTVIALGSRDNRFRLN